MQNIKTSVDEEFNILQTDVFIFCIKRLSEENKRVQTAQRLNLQNFGKISVECVLTARARIKCPDLGDLRAEHLCSLVGV